MDFDWIDMVEIENFGRKMSKHFLNCEPVDCIKQLNEALNEYGITTFDYNFLLGVRHGVEATL